MAKVHVRDAFDAPIDAVWSYFRDFGGVGKWGGGMVKSCTVEGEGVGAVRTIALAQGNPIRERLVQFDDADRSFPRESGPDDRFVELVPDLMDGITPKRLHSAYIRAIG